MERSRGDMATAIYAPASPRVPYHHLVSYTLWVELEGVDPEVVPAGTFGRPISGARLSLVDPGSELPLGLPASLLGAQYPTGSDFATATLVRCMQQFERLPAADPRRARCATAAGISAVMLGHAPAAAHYLRIGSQLAGDSNQPEVLAISMAAIAILALDQGDWVTGTAVLGDVVNSLQERGIQDLRIEILANSVRAVQLARAGQRVGATVALQLAWRKNSGSERCPLWLQVRVAVLQGHCSLLLGDIAGARGQVQRARTMLAPFADAVGIVAIVDKLDDAVSMQSPLTAAEQRVLPFLPTHLSFPEIVDHLFLSRHTVKTQALSIYRKLGVSSRSEAVAEARLRALIEPQSSFWLQGNIS